MVDYSSHIEINPEVMKGKPFIKGCRLTVESILRELSLGTPIEALTTNYEQLTKDSIYAALAFAADSLQRETARSGLR